ncbi:MAG: RidA family protein [Parvibaculales bacterium]
MKHIPQNLERLGLFLPAPKPALASYAPFTLSAGLLHVSGQGPVDGDGTAITGTSGADLDLETAHMAARLCAVNILAQVQQALEGDWSRLRRCLKLNGFVNATADFTQHPQIINGASDLIGDVLGDSGRHARSAVGVASLPLGWAVEIDALFEVRCD